MNQTVCISQSVPVQERIVAATCQYFRVEENDLLTCCDREGTYRKRVTSFLLRENTRMTFQSISTRLKYKNKNSAFVGTEEIRTHRKIYKQVANDVNEISRLALL